jgi:hypothetical protein
VTTNVNGWFDVTAYGATGNGIADDTAGCQSAITMCMGNGGGVVYFPVGQYLISSALTVNTTSASVPVTFLGTSMSGGNNSNSDGGTTILMSQTASTSTPNYGIYATSGGNASASFFSVRDLTMTCTVTNTAPTATFDAICTKGITEVDIERVQLFRYHNAAGVDIIGTTTNCGVHVIDATKIQVVNCDIYAQVSAIWNDSSTGLNVRDCIIGTAEGTGYGAIRSDTTSGPGGSGSVNIYNTVTGRGDCGLWCMNTGFVYANNFQVNLPEVQGLYFGTGCSQIWMEYAWISFDGPSSGPSTTGIQIDTGFKGWFYMENSVIQSPSETGVNILAGNGFSFVNNSFGGCGHSNPGTYADISISPSVSNVSIVDNHFDVDFANTKNGAIAAIWVREGATNVNVTGNIFTTGYAQATVIDDGNVVVAAGNVGWQSPWWTLTTDSGWSTVSGYAPMRVRFSPDGNLQFDGLLEYSSDITSNIAINSGTPLPDAFQPQYNAYLPSSSGGRAPVQVQPNGVVIALGSAGSTNRYAEIHEIIPTT